MKEGAEETRVVQHRASVSKDISLAKAGDVTAYYKMHLHAKTEWDMAQRLHYATQGLGLIVIENRVRSHFGYTFHTYYFCDTERKFPLICEPMSKHGLRRVALG